MPFSSHSTFNPHEETREEALLKGMNDFKNYISGARNEVAALRGESLNSSLNVSSLHDELDAVIKDTAEATHIILDCAEKIQCEISKENTEKQVILELITKVFEACTFQDITGQRISKVIQALHCIENEIQEIFSTYAISDPAPEPSPQTKEKDSLMNGPQLPKHMPSQEDIDNLFDKL